MTPKGSTAPRGEAKRPERMAAVASEAHLVAWGREEEGENGK
jgi:hypothetical protein